jgi:surfeit locus 1 family protein
MSKLKLPILLSLGVIIVLVMLRLAVWQLDRASEKQRLLDQRLIRSSQTEVQIAVLSDELNTPDKVRFVNVVVDGHYLPSGTIFIDNQVFAGQVGYQVYSPFQSDALDSVILVNRGWISVGRSRQDLPEISLPEGAIRLVGRLNLPPQQPPLWNQKYPVNQGAVWAYLPIEQYSRHFQIKAVPIVLELAPAEPHDPQLKRAWGQINDQWVAKHQGYAFQWFAMALAFSIACSVLLFRHIRSKRVS